MSWVFLTNITDEFKLGLDVIHAHDASSGAMCYDWAMRSATAAPWSATAFNTLYEGQQ
jgi:hypothetical protein